MRQKLKGRILPMGQINVAKQQARQFSEPRVLIFGQVSKQRDPPTVARSLAASFRSEDIETVIFTLYDPVQDFEALAGL